MSMRNELHNQAQARFGCTCSNCKDYVVTRYHCNVCDDFDLCVQCYEKNGHPHSMEKRGMDDDISYSNLKKAYPQDARKLSVIRCIQKLVHACQCHNVNCCQPGCQKMKRVVRHTKVCKSKTKDGCSVCKQLVAICCYHSKHCQQVDQLQRRMAAMNIRTTVPVGLLPGSSGVQDVGGAGSAVTPVGDFTPAASGSGILVGLQPSHRPDISGLKPDAQTPSAHCEIGWTDCGNNTSLHVIWCRKPVAFKMSSSHPRMDTYSSCMVSRESYMFFLQNSDKFSSLKNQIKTADQQNLPWSSCWKYLKKNQ
ncbi:histone lysine acetyltransferase CREBBP-like isoform X3 [Schistocerca gregaria]|uniref:histone lysine acetyltransferase CREBBP-like isoform X3 n=1 Tax=Schistocerca gregaria TaxID=7010 RepID=UPI00211EF944|nr:histone lysine acetyltransferase CREBBP-like isoform X3 [Schistocerca gregaria]